MARKKNIRKVSRSRGIERMASEIASEMAGGLYVRTEEYAARVYEYYTAAADELLRLSAGADIDSASGVFSFGSSRRMSAKSEAILRGLYSAVYQEIRKDCISEWERSSSATDRIVRLAMGVGAASDKRFARLFARNRDAMDAFFSRTGEYGGLNLSQKVWKYTGQLKDEMELALSVSLGRGDSASTVSRKVRQYLQEPERLFRRVRDEDGNLRLSKKAAAYHPGQGVYRSSYKNAMRLTRTETNMAYRAADCDRWSEIPFVVGLEVKRSNHPYACPVCEALAGTYPKDFKFVGWHPQCRCYIVPVMASEEETLAYHKAMLEGADVSGWEFSGEVSEPHEGFRKWVEANRGRIEGAKSLPYWVRDNGRYVGGAAVVQQQTGQGENASTSTSLVTPKTDREAFRQLQKETLKELGESGKIDITKEGLYTSHLYCAKADRKELIGHCYDSEELEALKKLPLFVQNIKDGRYVPIDMSRDNYKDKIINGVLHFTAYDVDINGIVYEFKCMAIKEESERNGRIVIEHPYSLKKKKS